MLKANDIADWFLSKIDKERGDTISPLKLQKLVYYAQAWHLAIFKKPLFRDRIEAWMNGPVIVSLFPRFAHLTKYSSINLEVTPIKPPVLEDRVENLLNEVFSIYGEHSASYLEDLSHSEAPWIDARGGRQPYEKCTEEITHKSMMEYYSKINES